MRSRLNLGFASASVMAVVMAAPVQAQEAPVDETVAQTTAPEESIVVTGSRLRNVTPFNSPDPIAVIDPQTASKEGKFDLASTLQSSPIAAGSTQITAAISSNFVSNGGPGAQTINLRGLGANRTLVLLNGRRAGPAGTRGAVSAFDLNVLPQAIAQNIQILKTGASSVYGSDAVAGVVNIITRTDTNGLELNGTISAPFDGGGEEYRVNAIWGKTFSRGHITIAGDYTKVNELARGDRAYLACPEAYTFREDGSRADLIDPRTGQYKCEDLRWGHVWTYDRPSGAYTGNMRLDGPGGPNTGVNTAIGNVNQIQFQYPGENLGIPTYGAPAFPRDIQVPAGWFPTGYDTASLAVQNSYHPFVEEQTIIPKTSLITAYADGSFALSDSVELFGEFLFNRRKTYQNGWRQFWNFGLTDDFLGTGAGGFNVWAPGWGGNNLVSPTGITNQADSSQKVDYYRGVSGLRGDFGSSSNWRWEAYGQYSKSIGRYRNQRILQEVYDIGTAQGFGSIGSCVGMVLPISGKQCIDLPWMDPYFLRGDLTPEQIAFIFDWEEGKTVYTQLSGEATVNGDLFTLPAGPVQVALGATLRRDRINDVPGEITRAANAWGSSASGITAGQSVTKELFGELNVPLLADKPFFQNLTLSAAARLTSVKATRKVDGVSDSDNGNWTYKLGANWALNDVIRFRASYGTSFRAPALFEQFLANETSFPNARNIDPCVNWQAGLTNGTKSQRVADNCAADGIPGNYVGGNITATAFSQGGLGNLRAETSNALVVGGILTPKFGFLPDTSINIAVDYFDIKVKGEITQLGAANILFGCYDSDDFANEPLCDLFTRGQTADPLAVNEVYNQFVNIARQRNSGVDVNVNIRHDLGKLGRLSLTADMTWQTKDTVQLLPGSVPTTNNGEAGSPKWVGDFRLSWAANGGTTLYYGMNVIGGTSDAQDFLDRNGGDPCINSATRGRYCPLLTTNAVFYHNASITQEVADRFEITLGVSNIFNTRPPRVSVLNGGTISMLGPVVAASQYGFSGRRGFISVKSKF